MTKKIKVLLLIAVVLTMAVLTFYWRDKPGEICGYRGEVTEIKVELPGDFEEGTYMFDFENGPKASHRLCFCLAEKNSFPPDCSGDIRYIYRNSRQNMCVPMIIGNGDCRSRSIQTKGYASNFYIPANYAAIQYRENIVAGIKIGQNVPLGAGIVVRVNFYKKDLDGNPAKYRSVDTYIRVCRPARKTAQQHAI